MRALPCVSACLHTPQTVLPFIYYATYIIATIVLGRGAEPLHADPRRHEIPHFRTTSYLDDVWVERAAAELQAERQVQALALALEQQRREDDERQQQLRLQPQQQGQQGQDGDCERQLQLQLQRQGQQGQGQVVHVVVGSQDDAHACSNGASNATCEAKAAIGTQRTHCHEVAADEAGHDSQDPTSGQRQSFGQRQCALDRSGSMRPPHGLFDLLQGVWTGRIRVGRRGGGAGSSRRDSVAAGAGVESGSALQQPLLQQQPQQPQQPQQQIHRQPQAGGCMALVAAHCDDMTPDTPPAPGACPSCGVCGPSPCDADPEQAKRAQHAQHAQHAQQPCTMGCGVCGRALLRDPQLGLQYPDSSSHDKDAGARKRPRFGDLRGGRGHSDIAEGLRHSDDGDSEDGLCIGGGGGGGVQIRWGRLLRSPVTFMLSITMPLISNREV